MRHRKQSDRDRADATSRILSGLIYSEMKVLAVRMIVFKGKSECVRHVRRTKYRKKLLSMQTTSSPLYSATREIKYSKGVVIPNVDRF